MFNRSSRGMVLGNIRCHYRKPVFAIGTIVTRDTLLRRYRQLIAKKYDKSTARKPGRPKIVAEIEKLILDMTRNSPGWGYTRICGALYNVGQEIGRNTDKRILLDNGIDPAPLRSKGMSWSTFLKTHCAGIAATDFFSRRDTHPRRLSPVFRTLDHWPSNSPS